jgi:hypothetical protein
LTFGKELRIKEPKEERNEKHQLQAEGEKEAECRAVE